MYEYIVGIYSGLNKDYIIIENNNIGYKIYTSGSTMANIPNINEEVKIYLEQVVREDFIGLYGFLSKEELLMFKLLLSISGVGAKAALSLLSIASVQNLKLAIITDDLKTLMKAPGVGKKTAQRIILEVKDKISKEEIGDINTGNINEINKAESIDKIKIDEAKQALISLGYSEREAKKAIENVDAFENLESIIKKSLRYLLK